MHFIALPRALLRALARATIVAGLFLGLLASAFWLTIDDPFVAISSFQKNILWVPPIILSSTILSIGVRFLRWHYLLRINGLLVPLRDSVRIYVAGFAMVLTPAYTGEIVKALLLRWRYTLPLRNTVPIVVGERLFDVAAILLIAVASAGWRRSPGWGVLLSAAAVLTMLTLFWSLGLVSRRLSSRLSVAGGNNGIIVNVATVAARVTAPGPAILCLGLSVASWLIAASSLLLSLALGQVTLSPLDALYAFTYGTAAGAFSLLPAGAGITGSTMILELGNASVPTNVATVTILLIRLCTIWFAAGIGFVMLGVLTRRFMWPDRYLTPNHFEELAPHYAQQIPAHVRDHLVSKKIAPMLPRLHSERPLVGVDLGCGQGWYAVELARRTGHRVLGLDLAQQQIRTGMLDGSIPSRDRDFVAGHMLALPLQTGSIDFVYSINSLHHLGGTEEQEAALAEVARVLKPGGCFFLHEMNVKNPVLRFYLGYVFPLLRAIDEGTEHWLYPGRISSVPGLQQVDLEYFGFVPDFLPRPLMRSVMRVEKLLEASPLQSWGAYYMAVFVRVPAPQHPSPLVMSKHPDTVTERKAKQADV